MEYFMSKNIANDNPCGMCRSLGLRVCKGHGAASGGGSPDSEEAGQQAASQTDSGSTPLNSPVLKPKNDALSDLLEHSPLWHQMDEFIFQFKNPNGLLSMTVDMENNTLSCQGKDDLTQEEQQALDMLFEAIEQEFNRFEKEFSTTHSIQASISRVGNQLTVNISDPKCFDAFIQGLANKNLLVLSDKNIVQAQPDSEQKKPQAPELKAPQSEQTASSWTPPTPFDMTPKG